MLLYLKVLAAAMCLCRVWVCPGEITHQFPRFTTFSLPLATPGHVSWSLMPSLLWIKRRYSTLFILSSVLSWHGADQFKWNDYSIRFISSYLFIVLTRTVIEYFLTVERSCRCIRHRKMNSTRNVQI